MTEGGKKKYFDVLEGKIKTPPEDLLDILKFTALCLSGQIPEPDWDAFYSYQGRLGRINIDYSKNIWKDTTKDREKLYDLLKQVISPLPSVSCYLYDPNFSYIKKFLGYRD